MEEESENDVDTVLLELDFDTDDCLDRMRGVLDRDLVCFVLDGDLDTDLDFDLGDLDLKCGDLCLLLVGFGELDPDLE